MLEPKKIKYRKVHRGNRKGMAKGGTEVNFGSYGMKAMEPGWITARQIEATRISISRRVRKVGKMWIRIFPDKPITKKPLETRMGKGKGSPEYWVANVRPGRILFEVEGISKNWLKKLLELLEISQQSRQNQYLEEVQMKIEDLRKLSENDLKSRLIDNLESLQKYRFQKSIQQLEDYKLISEMKKENAKINTVLKELSINGENN